MANRWNIPKYLENAVRQRDKNCVYCRCEFTSFQVNRRTSPSWEHIVNDATIITLENITLCCMACNASKGQKPLLDWLASDYCRRRGITQNTVAPIVQEAIQRLRTLG